MTWRAVLLVAVTACRSNDKPAPKPVVAADAKPESDVHAQLLGCGPAVPLPEDPRDLRTPRRGPTRLTHQWTPFALLPVVAEDAVSKPAAIAVIDDVKDRLPVVDKCFADAVGTVRAMISIDITGAAQSIRAGGLGDAAIESCVALALEGLRVTPPQFSVELACDFARGRTDAPLRVSPDGGYAVVEVAAHEVRVDGATHVLPKQRITSLGVKATVLVLADPDATPEGLDFALWWAPPATTIIAVKAAGGAPVFVGMGDSRAERLKSDKRVVQLKTDNGRMHACLANSELGNAPILDFKAMDGVMAKVREACSTQSCAGTIVVGTSGTFVAKDLVATTSAARRAGFAAISIGGPVCN